MRESRSGPRPKLQLHAARRLPSEKDADWHPTQHTQAGLTAQREDGRASVYRQRKSRRDYAASLRYLQNSLRRACRADALQQVHKVARLEHIAEERRRATTVWAQQALS